MVDSAGKKNPTIKRYRYDLKEFAQLRNAIVHDRAGDQVIAEPHLTVVEEIEHIVELITHPPHVIPLFAKKVYVLLSDASISKALNVMSRYDVAKLPVLENGKCIGLLTSNTITRWLGTLPSKERVNLQDKEIGSILSHNKHADHYLFRAKDCDISEIVDLFDSYERRGRRLDAILLSENGEPHNKFLGIITLGDLPKAIGALEP